MDIRVPIEHGFNGFKKKEVHRFTQIHTNYKKNWLQQSKTNYPPSHHASRVTHNA